MSRDKQIEEMARDICRVEERCSRIVGCQPTEKCRAYKYAERAYTAGYRKSEDVAREIDDLKRYILRNEDIAIKCKRENGEQNEEYWKGKIAAFRQVRSYIDAELEKKYTEGGE